MLSLSESMKLTEFRNAIVKSIIGLRNATHLLSWALADARHEHSPRMDMTTPIDAESMEIDSNIADLFSVIYFAQNK